MSGQKGGDPMQENYEALANAIILRAVKDYRWARRALKRDPEDREAEKMKKDAENFLRSPYFRILTNVHPDYLMRKLKEEED